jgi:pyruvate dehydrogenase E2 component (dihydrolipoamide acetyltransferase)
MAEAIRMPLLSDTMKEGVIAAWHKKLGDQVKSDEAIADVETDKATMEVLPYVDGTLLYIGVEQGKAAKVNDIIAIVGKEGEDYKALLDEGGQPAEATEQKAEDANPAADDKQEEPKQATAEEKPKPASAPQPAAKGNIPDPKDATVIRMPLLSDTMTEGKIAAWHFKEGDAVKNDDALADVETDKATMEVMGYVDGTLLHIGVQAGQSAKVNGIIAIVGKAGTDISGLIQEGGNEPQSPTADKQEPAQPAANQQPTTAEKTPEPEAVKPTAEEPAPKAEGERVFASPLARKMAEEKGIDLHELKGSGDGGRVIRRDVESYKPVEKPMAQPQQQQQAGKPPAAVQQPSGNLGQEGHTDTPLSQMRRIIAQRLGESKFSAPHFYLRMTITMDKAMESRKAMNDVSPVKISFNDLIIKACAMSLRKHPEVNSSWMGDSIRQNHHIHIGTAVAVEEGLIVPVIKFADQKSLSHISDEANVLIEKARNKKLQPPEFTGNTFTISNLGMMDIDEFTAIINPPDACILAIGKIAPTPVVENGQVVVRNLMKLTLSCDHRVVDGAVGARFMQTLKAHLENPVTMLV